VHIIQALLGHESADTTMIYVKLYPHTLIAEYRGALRGRYQDISGKDAFHSPTLAEWETFSRSCNLRDMGTHLCALPAGAHCARGLVCLGCSHAQPKRSALPIFEGMLASHQASLTRARAVPEPAGQIAARELEIDRIRSATQRARDLHSDVAAALEAGRLIEYRGRLKVHQSPFKACNRSACARCRISRHLDSSLLFIVRAARMSRSPLCVTAISLHLKPAISGTFAGAISVAAFLKVRANIEEAG
jgi:hypothetical protein